MKTKSSHLFRCFKIAAVMCFAAFVFMGLPNTAQAVPTADFTFSPTYPSDGQSVTFDASSSTESGDIARYSWEFAQGSNTSSLTLNTPCCISIGYDGGELKAKLTLKDSNGVIQDTVVKYVPPRTKTQLSAIDDPIDGRYCASTNGTAATVDVMENDVFASVVGSSTIPGQTVSLRTRGDYAYVGGYQFAVYDISDPTNPQQISTLEFDSTQQSRDIHFSENENYVYVADSTSPPGTDTGASVYVVDISSKANPKVVDYISTDYGYKNGSWGGESIDKRSTSSDYLYLADNNPGDIWSIDVSDPSNLSFATGTALSSVPIDATCREAISGDDAYDCEGKYPLNPTVWQTKEVMVNGDYAYTVHPKEEAIKVTDISNPQDTQQVGSVSMPITAPETIKFVSDTHAYVGGDDGEIAVIDVSDPVNPSVVNTLSINGEDITSFAVHENEIYASLSKVNSGDQPDASVTGGIISFDISDPANPETLWAKQIGNSPERIYREGDYIYLVDGQDRTMYVVDPSAGDIAISTFSQPDNGTVSLDDNGTVNDETDDKLAYYPSATGTDSFTYTITPNPSAGASAQDTATTSFDVQAEQCNQGNININASPQDVPQKDGFSTTSISWSYDNVTRCETQDGNSQWRNIDPDQSANCLELPNSDG